MTAQRPTADPTPPLPAQGDAAASAPAAQPPRQAAAPAAQRSEQAAPPGRDGDGAPEAPPSAPGGRFGAHVPRPAPRQLALAAILALSAVLNVYRLSQNSYGNIFYSAGVRSMLRSWHNFLFVSFDPGGLVSIDKPPLGLWLQAASAKLFGFAPLPLLLPEAIAGVLAVAVLYLALRRSFGAMAGLSGALALAVFPSFVAVSRVNAIDPLMILLMTLAADAGLRACASGRWPALLWSAALVGLAFNVKTLAAYLVVPGIALAYVVCAPGTVPRRLLQLLAAGALMLALSFSWIAFVEATPASKRPYVGGSTNNTELGLTFDYNGFGRVEGETGGPGRIPVGGGALAHSFPIAPGASRPPPPGAPRAAPRAGGPGAPGAAARAHPPGTPPALLPNGRERKPIAFGGPVGALRLFGRGLGDQGAWMLPFALFGLLATALVTLGPGRDRRDPRLAALLVLGGWFVVEAAVLSLSKGIVHPYYMSALGPGLAAMCGTGVAAFYVLARRPLRDWRRLLAPLAIVATVIAQIVLLYREHYLLWLVPALIAGATAAACVLLSLRRRAPGVLTLAFALLLVAPTAYATTTWLAPVEGTFPAAGPKAATGGGRLGIAPVDERRDRLLAGYVASHHPTRRFELLADASNTASPFILLGRDAAALAGYSGTDPAVSAKQLARMVDRSEARYVVLGGEFSTRGGNAATLAVLRACLQLAPTSWQGARPRYLGGLVLFDCAGRERELAAA